MARASPVQGEVSARRLHLRKTQLFTSLPVGLQSQTHHRLLHMSTGQFHANSKEPTETSRYIFSIDFHLLLLHDAPNDHSHSATSLMS